MLSHSFDSLVEEARIKQLKQEIQRALKSGEGVESLRDDLKEADADLPILQRYLVNDTTIEKLGEILNENPNGILLFVMNCVGWLRTLDKDGHENARCVLLRSMERNWQLHLRSYCPWNCPY